MFDRDVLFVVSVCVHPPAVPAVHATGGGPVPPLEPGPGHLGDADCQHGRLYLGQRGRWPGGSLHGSTIQNELFQPSTGA